MTGIYNDIYYLRMVKMIQKARKKKSMEICLNDLLYAVSYALDCVEHELIGATIYHAKRVAYLSVQTGRVLGLNEQELLNLAACAVLHDNALTEYIQSEYLNGTDVVSYKEQITLGAHCSMGEDNISQMPFYSQVKDVILYHHERADGNGPFGRITEQTPLLARLIHLADNIDVEFDLNSVSRLKYEKVCNYLTKNIGILFDEIVVKAFMGAFPLEKMQQLQGENIEPLLHNCLPVIKIKYTDKELIGLSTIFAKITDYKSRLTSKHSLEIARKAKKMGRFYGYGKEEQAKLYFAGALHDIGKLIVDTDILEKPGKLTEEEYLHVQNHAYATYQILHSIEGLEDITSWASMHHEKLDGSGYPFGKTAEELGHNERLMACLDIYQALVEARSYKNGMPHKKAMKILYKMAADGKLDERIVYDIDECFGQYTINVTAGSIQ